MMRLLITGASGYIGSRLIEQLQENDKLEIYSLDSRPLPKDWLRTDEHIITDLTDIEELENKLEGLELDVVIHLAALIRGEISNLLMTNVIGTANLLDILSNKTPKLAIFTSTAGQLYRNAQYTPIDERHPVNPVTPYGISKKLAEEIVNYYHRSYGLPTLIFRQANVYGFSPNPSPTVINKFIEKAVNDGELTIYGDGTQVRNFIHIDDLMNFYMNAIDTQKPQVLAGETMNIGGSEEYQIKEIAQLVKDSVDEKVEITYTAPEIPAEKDIYLFKLEIEKAKSLLDYEPRISVSDGIKRVLKSIN